MTHEHDDAGFLIDTIARAHAQGGGLRIAGAGSKAMLASGLTHGPQVYAGELISTLEHRGVIDYRPEELVVTVRAGTPIDELESVLSAAGQYLPFEPPRFRGGGTIGGAVATGLSGPGRPWRGAVRDAVLGVELVNGIGERLRFGGQVMKNVAGYDLSRLQVGAFGSYGLILSVSLKVLPRPAVERTLAFSLSEQQALERCRVLARKPYPVTAACWVDGVLRIRLAGAEPAVAWAAAELGGEMGDDDFWDALRDQRLDFFRAAERLWRGALPPGAALPATDCILNWGGGERWWRDLEPAAAIELAQRVRAAGGQLCSFDARFGMLADDGLPGEYARRLKAAFDPQHVLNPHLVINDAD